MKTNSFITYDYIYNDIEGILKDIDKQNFISKLSQIHNDYIKSNKPSKTKPIRRFWHRNFNYYAAAFIAVLIAIGFVVKLYVFKPNLDTEKFFEQYYTTYKLDNQTRSVVSDNKILNLAINAYEQKSYYKAIELLSSIESNDLETTIKVNFFKGISCIEVSDYKEAIDSLNKVLKSDTSLYRSQSHWYLALTWLKLNNIDMAKEHLNWLIINDRYYNTIAKTILEQLKIYFLFPSRQITISPLIGFVFNVSNTSERVPLIVSSYFFDISREIDTLLLPPKTSINCSIVLLTLKGDS